MRPVTQTRQLDAADDDGILTEQAIAAAGNLSIEGAFASAGVASLDAGRQILLTASLNLSTDTFTITGTDGQGRVVSESLVGPNAGTVATVRDDWATVTEVSVDGAIGVFSFSTLTLTGNAVAGETVTLGSTVYTFAAVPSSANEVDVGGSASVSLDNLIAAINGAAGEGTLYGTGTVANTEATAVAGGGDTMDVTAISPILSVGDAVASTETMGAEGTWTSTVLAGGDGIELGTNGVGAGIPVPLDLYLDPFSVTLDVNITGTLNVDAQFTNDDIYSGVGPFNWAVHSGLDGISADDVDTLIAPVTAVRLLTNSGTGSAIFRVIQAGAL